MYSVRVEGTRVVLDACLAAGLRRVVVASTSGTVAVSEDPDHLATESDAAPLGIIGRWPYYRAKLFAEQAALSRNRAGFEVVSVNPSLLLGPGDMRGSSPEDVRRFLEGELPAVPSEGLSFVDARVPPRRWPSPWIAGAAASGTSLGLAISRWPRSLAAWPEPRAQKRRDSRCPGHALWCAGERRG